MDVGDYLVRRQTPVAADRPIVRLIVVVRVISPRWEPPAVFPTPVAPIKKNNGNTMSSPPIPIVVMLRVLAMFGGRLS